MPTSGTWPFSNLSSTGLATIGIELGATPRDARSLLAHGAVDVFPIGRAHNDEIVGLRAMPGRPLATCPVVFAPRRTGESTAVSDDASRFLPYAILERGLLGEPGTWTRLAGLDEPSWGALEEAHAALGGTADALRQARAALGNPAFSSTLDDRRANAMTWPDTWSEAVLSIDAESPRHRLQLLMDAVEFFEPYEAPTASSLGVFEALGWATAMQQGPDPSSLANAVLKAALLPAGHEAAYTTMVKGPTARGLASGEFGLCASAGRRLSKPEEPLPKACAIAGEVFATYDGLAHAEAAATLRGTGDFTGAVSAMLSALFWSQARHGTVNEPMVGAYQELVHEAEFETHAEVLERLLSLAS